PVGSSGGNERQEEPEQRSMATPGAKALDREAYWKQFVQRLDGREAEFKRRLKKAFQEQQNQVSRRIRDGAASPEEVLEGVDEEWAAQMARELGPMIRDTLLAAGREAIEQVQPEQTGFKQLDLDPHVIDWLQNRVFKFSVEVTQTTIEQLRATLIEGYLNGERPAQLVDRVAEVFRMAKGHRAERIARTEMVRAMNHGTLFGWRQTGLVAGKEWVAALDERTRPDHMHADGQVVPLHEKFTVGGWPMEVPGDPSAPAEQVVNCRCTVAPVLEGEMP
ncbi:MAG TPA: phage minor head protein, partial [Thermaerobacter sp.]